MKKTINKNGAGKITSKVTKPKDWAFRTPAEGRPKSVISRRAKPVKMHYVLWKKEIVRDFVIYDLMENQNFKWQVSCENPTRKLTAQDLIDLVRYPQPALEVKCNIEHKICIFVDLTDVLTGGHEEPIPAALTAKEIEIAKRHWVDEVYPCKKCGKYGPCKCGPKFNKSNK